jgi:hypothetical protein
MLICPNYIFSFKKKIICKLSDVWLFLRSKKLGCSTHIMNIDPKIFWHQTYSKFRFSENIKLVWKNLCSFDHFILWLSDLWRILKIVLSGLTPKKGQGLRSDTKQNCELPALFKTWFFQTKYFQALYSHSFIQGRKKSYFVWLVIGSNIHICIN